ncbi:MAG TPA: hypothetical protein VFR03_15530 [Thermoanaerobaculia bacterium]|nr:hypothetical protein [Thermoanaerobaculia bacterium]
MTDPSLDPIFAYLREHSGRYSLSALREQLLQTGYDPALVDRAIAIYQQENPPTLAESIWSKALLVAGGNVLLVILGILSLLSGKGDTVQLAGYVLLLALGGEILGGIVLFFSPKGRLWGRALLFGFLLTLALALLLGGVCFLILSQSKW